MSASSLSRTSSTASVSSSEDAGDNSSATVVESRRTRKRFTSSQLVILENLFHQTSHPSREQREMAARLGGMEMKSVTIWFQNKRQTERKVALTNNTVNNSRGSLSSSSSNRSSRPSLDRVASRSELPMAVPRTPVRQRNPNATIWDNMLSSPIGPPPSPPSRELVQFGKSRRTLEWACAAARLTEKHTITTSNITRARRVPKPKRQIREGKEGEGQDLSDDELPEAVTPPATIPARDIRWRVEPDENMPHHLEVEDDDMLNAALTLCGMGRKS